MNRKQRHVRRKFEVGSGKNSVQRQRAAITAFAEAHGGRPIFTQTITTASGDHYWFECAADFDVEKDRLPTDVIYHGPFKTHALVKEHQRVTLFGPQCKVTEGGMWDPNWNKPQ